MYKSKQKAGASDREHFEHRELEARWESKRHLEHVAVGEGAGGVLAHGSVGRGFVHDQLAQTHRALHTHLAQREREREGGEGEREREERVLGKYS